MTQRALLLIDIQNDYFPGGRYPLVGIEAAAANAARLLEAARAAGETVVHVRHEFAGPDAPFFSPGTEGAQIHPSVAPLPGESVVLKNQVNAFRDTDLKATLDAAGVEELTVVGAMSHMCIDAGVRAASDLGYKVRLAHDAAATRDQEFGGVTTPAAQTHAAFMAALGFAYADVRSADELIAG